MDTVGVDGLLVHECEVAIREELEGTRSVNEVLSIESMGFVDGTMMFECEFRFSRWYFIRTLARLIIVYTYEDGISWEMFAGGWHPHSDRPRSSCYSILRTLRESVQDAMRLLPSKPFVVRGEI